MPRLLVVALAAFACADLAAPATAYHAQISRTNYGIPHGS